MPRNRVLLMAVLALGVASPALAVTKGGTLYVKVKNTRLMDSAATSANLVQVLQPGQTVTWLGADPKNKQWHHVEVVNGKKGVVFQSTLSSQPPSMELVAGDNGPTRKNAEDFANSAAAVKLLSDGAIEYGNGQGKDMQRAVDGLQKLERLAQRVDADKLSEHARRAGLSPVVGPSKGSRVASGGGQ